MFNSQIDKSKWKKKPSIVNIADNNSNPVKENKKKRKKKTV